jgi:S-adenosyl-L-methionine hydrolase (adenosine-forming)
MTATITLTTDFGTRDSYVAQLKGVLLQLGPAALRIVDLSHEIGAQNVREAAFFLRCAVPRFAPGTVHLAIVDPGVGSARRALVAEARGQYLIGPDNGIFGWLLDAGAHVHALTATPQSAPGGSVSSTFHGRDVFAPAAARLARGEALAVFGPRVVDPVRLAWPQPVRSGARTSGEVVHVDRFGNLISNIERDALPAGPSWVSLGAEPIGPLRDHYAEVGQGALLALIGSEGLLEVAVRDGSAAVVMGVGVGAKVEVETKSPAGT